MDKMTPIIESLPQVPVRIAATVCNGNDMGEKMIYRVEVTVSDAKRSIVSV